MMIMRTVDDERDKNHEEERIEDLRIRDLGFFCFQHEVF